VQTSPPFPYPQALFFGRRLDGTSRPRRGREEAPVRCPAFLLPHAPPFADAGHGRRLPVCHCRQTESLVLTPPHSRELCPSWFAKFSGPPGPAPDSCPLPPGFGGVVPVGSGHLRRSVAARPITQVRAKAESASAPTSAQGRVPVRIAPQSLYPQSLPGITPQRCSSLAIGRIARQPVELGVSGSSDDPERAVEVRRTQPRGCRSVCQTPALFADHRASSDIRR